jgi:pimeloyl-ACP methyl ester carboxylesterase
MTSPEDAAVTEGRPTRWSTLSSDGARICWITKGRGRPLLLVHGGGADHTRLEPFADLLTDSFTVHLVDRRGRGMSGDGATYDIELEYDDIAAVAETIGHDVTVLGHSYGGPIAIGAAARTDAISRVVAYEGWPSPPGSPSTYEPGETVEGIQARIDEGDRDGAVSLVFRDVVGLADSEIDAMRAQPSWPARLAAAPTLPRELRAEPSIQLATADLVSIGVPVLLVIGGQNEASLRPGADRLCSIMRDAQVCVLPGQGHMAFDTAPELLVSLLRSWRS